jgi:serine/threonine protein kinase
VNAALQTGMMSGCGSALWMAPEILRGEVYNEKIDV